MTPEELETIAKAQHDKHNPNDAWELLSDAQKQSWRKWIKDMEAWADRMPTVRKKEAKSE